MTLYTLPNGTSGLDTIFVSIISEVPSFVPSLLTFIFFLVFLGGIGMQKGRNGTADYPLWSTIASTSTFLSASLLTVITGYIKLDWLVIIIVITIFSAVWLFLDKRGSEF